jgi:hypothetical protein
MTYAGPQKQGYVVDLQQRAKADSDVLQEVGPALLESFEVGRVTGAVGELVPESSTGAWR